MLKNCWCLVCFFFIIHWKFVFISAAPQLILAFGTFCAPSHTCVVYYDCPDYALLPMRKAETFRMLRRVMCGTDVMGNKKYPKVCCPTENPTQVVTTTTQSSRDILLLEVDDFNVVSHQASYLLPGDCGRQMANSTDYRITGGSIAVPGEFPWMALLAYQSPEKDHPPSFKCSGSLISKEYILTAAHCVVDDSLFGVRLGEHDLLDIDKDEVSTHQDFIIESVIVHSQYDFATSENDIALIKLEQPAEYTDKVQPICLPDTNINLFGKEATVAGWGTTESGQRSSILRKVDLPVISAKECARRIGRLRRFKAIGVNQICAGGQLGKDSCNGDSGSPLFMRDSRNKSPRFVQYGIVSFGPKHCGTEGIPGVYTRVGKYVSWILDHIEN